MTFSGGIEMKLLEKMGKSWRKEDTILINISRHLSTIPSPKISYKEEKGFILGVMVSWNWQYVMCCAIWYHLYNLKNVKNIHKGVQLQPAIALIPPWVFFPFFNLYKWYQIAQSITCNAGWKKRWLIIHTTITKRF